MEKFEIEKIPKEWEKEKLNHISNIIMGQSPPSNSYNETGNGLPFYQGKTDFGFITPGIRLYCSNPKKIAEINDILISVRAPVGPVNINKIKSCIGRGLASIRSTNIYNLFLYYSLIFNEKKITELGTGSTFHSINKSQLENFIILKPPLPEQKKIAYVLSTIQKAIEKQEEIIQTTTELKKSMMHKLFIEGLYGEKQKKTEIGLVPKSWEVVELGKISEKPQYGFTEKARNTGNVKFLRITDIQNGNVNWFTVPYCNCTENIINKFLLLNGDIVFARIGATTGKSFIIKNCPKNSIFASYLIRIRIKKDNIPNYIYYYFNTNQYWKIVNSNKVANLKGGINATILNKLLIPLPKPNEQHQIANILSSIDNKIEYHTNKKKTLEELFKSMLHNLMTGKIRVNEINFDKIKEEQ